MERSWVPPIVAGMLALGAFTLAFTSFRYTLSEINSYQGKRYEKHWEKRGAIASTGQWQAGKQWM